MGTEDHSCATCEHDQSIGGDGRGQSRSEEGLTRRAAVVGGLGLTAWLAGCLDSDGGGLIGGDETTAQPDPITLTQEHSCDICGMVIPNHPGPSAEVFYADEQPSGHENPARFCSTWEAFKYDFERDNQGWERQAFYVTDYSTVEYELLTDAGDTLISAHVQAEAFTDATDVTFVAGSNVKGAMGKDLIGFSGQDDAEEFQSEHGGQVVAFADVSETTIQQLASQ